MLLVVVCLEVQLCRQYFGAISMCDSVGLRALSNATGKCEGCDGGVFHSLLTLSQIFLDAEGISIPDSIVFRSILGQQPNTEYPARR